MSDNRRCISLKDLAVVTAAFGNVEGLVRWAGIWSATGAECVIADNGGLLPDSFPPAVRVLAYNGNTGFGAGINRAVEASSASRILVTNPDTLPTSRSSLNELLLDHRKGRLSAGSLIDSNGTVQPSGGIWPDIPWLRSQLFAKTPTLWRNGSIQWIQGALILCHRSDFESLGGFSSSFPLYFEDVDLCARASRIGIRPGIVERASFQHCEGTGSSGSAALRIACFHWGAAEFFRIHRPMNYHKARTLILAKCLTRTLILLPIKPERALGFFRGFKSILRGTPPILPERADEI